MEIMVTITIIAILAGLLITGAMAWRERSEGIKCAQNLKSLQVSLASYVTDVGHWPQEPKELWESNDNDGYEDWWIAELSSYGGSEAVWKCPTIVRRFGSKLKDSRPRIHYTPTMFDEKPSTPYKWSTQPWLAEIGNMHGQGALLCFPDGSVKPQDDALRGF